MRVVDRRDAALGTLLFIGTALYFGLLPPSLNPADESVYLYEAKRLLAGAVPYRDFFEITTPGWIALMAALFRVFGTDLATARIAAAVIHGLAAALIVLACRQLGVRRSLSWPPALAYLVICVPAWPIASQHWLTTLLMLLLLLVCARRAGRRWPVVAGVLLGLVIAIHQQRGVILALGTATWLVVDRLLVGDGPGARAPLGGELVGLGAGVLAVVVPMLAALAAVAGAANVWRALVVHPLLNYGGTTHCPWGDVNVMTAIQGTFTFPRVLKYLPVVVVPTVVRLGWLMARGQRTDEVRRLLLLVFFCAAAAGSIAYFPDFIHIAFIAPLFFVAASENLEAALRAAPVPGWGRGLGSVAGLVLMAGAAARLHSVMQRSEAMYPFVHPTAFGRIAFSSRADVRFYETLNRLLDETRPRQVFCYPGVSALYLLTNADNATRFQFFHAGYASPDQVREVLDTLEAKQLAYVAVLASFVDLDDSVMAYVRRNYEPVAGQDGASYRLFRRKERVATS